MTQRNQARTPPPSSTAGIEVSRTIKLWFIVLNNPAVCTRWSIPLAGAKLFYDPPSVYNFSASRTFLFFSETYFTDRHRKRERERKQRKSKETRYRALNENHDHSANEINLWQKPKAFIVLTSALQLAAILRRKLKDDETRYRGKWNSRCDKRTQIRGEFLETDYSAASHLAVISPGVSQNFGTASRNDVSPRQ